MLQESRNHASAFLKDTKRKKLHAYKKGTVISLAVSLKLNLEQTKKLLRSAGLAFTHSSKSDLIVEYFIINEKWNLFQINEALDSYGLEPLK